MTIVINLFGAPCSGKTTAAAGTFYNLKLRHKHCELVREYIKNWSWENRKPGKYDQVYFFGKQAKYESTLYEKVDYLVTESPIILCGFYEHWHHKEDIVGRAAMDFMQKAQQGGVVYKNFWLEIPAEFDSRGRHHSESESREVSAAMLPWLKTKGIEPIMVDANATPENRVDFILGSLNPMLSRN